jgi:hypothetical protein
MTQENTDNEAITFAKFLENIPPGTQLNINDLGIQHSNGGNIYFLNTPEIQLHCPSEPCNGIN